MYYLIRNNITSEALQKALEMITECRESKFSTKLQIGIDNLFRKKNTLSNKCLNIEHLLERLAKESKKKRE